MLHLKKAFTLVEILIILAIVAVLVSTMFVMGGPYVDRSRDVARLADIISYSRTADVYFKEYDTLPSNTYLATNDYCADTVFFNRSSVLSMPDSQFEYLKNLMNNRPLIDPVNSTPPIYPCTRTGSYFYSKVITPDNKIYSLFGTRIAILKNANYFTGSDISSTGYVNPQNLIFMQDSFKGSVKESSHSDFYYFLATQF